jgi:hypothetical protein
MIDDSGDALLARLREACRSERPDDTLREQTLERVLAVEPRRRFRALWGLVPLAAGLALVLGHRAGPLDTPSIGAERLSASGASGRTLQRVSEPPVPTVHEAVPSSVSRAQSPQPSTKPARVLTIEEETAALERVQSELRAGRPAAALASLDAYDKAAHGGRLASEALFLRIQALASSGRTAQASKLAERLLRDNPNSPLVDRARKYLVTSDARTGVGDGSQVGKPGDEQ